MSYGTYTAIFLYLQLMPAPALALTQSPLAIVVFPVDKEIIDHPIPISLPLKQGMLIGVNATAYSSTVGQTDSSPFITASGTRVRAGIIASNFLPLGATVRIDTKEYIVEDRMNARYNNMFWIDIWMPSTSQALTFGVQPVIIEIASLPDIDS